MEQTITCKERVNKNECLKFKTVSLMKKQIFTLMMLLALMVMAGGSAFAQMGTGDTRTDSRLVVVGSVSTFSIADAVTTGGTPGTSFAWSVYSVTDDAEAYATNGGTAATASQARFVTDVTTLTAGATNETTAYVNWLAAPDAGDTYAVQVIVNNANCSTTRRFFVSVFDFTVSIQLCDASGNAYAADQTRCNTWSTLVVGNSVNTVNPFEGDAITTPHADYINATGGVAKITPTYFKVNMALSGNPSGFDLRNIKWRFQYTMPTATAMSIYTISTATAAEFDTEGSGTKTVGGATGTAVYTVPAGNYIYVPRATGTDPVNSASYLFTVNTHNNLSQDNMIYTARLDRVSLEFSAVAGSYNDGAKIWTTYGTGEPLIGAANELTVSQTIYMSPATSVIDFAE